MEDKRNILKDEQPFKYKLLKDNKARVFFENKIIKIVHGNDYLKLIAKINDNDNYELQLFLAKITKNFKRGNEKANK
ncbi:MAG: hypothetical protein IPK18_10220 [Sphingobacteriales bacterium]|nr:MAG: hypothetical protein IPK18_10220 [Sphingobacteriales bacterium]